MRAQVKERTGSRASSSFSSTPVFCFPSFAPLSFGSFRKLSIPCFRVQLGMVSDERGNSWVNIRGSNGVFSRRTETVGGHEVGVGCMDGAQVRGMYMKAPRLVGLVWDRFGS